MKTKIILTFLMLIFGCSISWAEDPQNKDNVYYTAYQMAMYKCQRENIRQDSIIACIDKRVVEYIKMLREAK